MIVSSRIIVNPVSQLRNADVYCGSFHTTSADAVCYALPIHPYTAFIICYTWPCTDLYVYGINTVYAKEMRSSKAVRQHASTSRLRASQVTNRESGTDISVREMKNGKLKGPRLLLGIALLVTALATYSASQLRFPGFASADPSCTVMHEW